VSDMLIPDLMEPIVSWRLWHPSGPFGQEGHQRAYLVALNQTPVEPYVKASAHCRGNRSHDPFLIEFTCSCGFYSYKTFGDLVAGTYMGNHHWSPQQFVIGTVNNWGKVFEYTKGYRSQFIYPKELLASTPRMAAALERTYGVPCEVANVFEMLEDVKRKAMERARELARQNRLLP